MITDTLSNIFAVDALEEKASYVVFTLMASMGGILTAYAGIIKAKKEGDDDCEKVKNELRKELEAAMAELHFWRMKFPEIDPRKP